MMVDTMGCCMALGPGRPPIRPVIRHVRELTSDDLKAFRRGRENPIKRFRDSHLMMARLFASGLRPGEVAHYTGYSISRVSVFYNNPAFQELIAKERELGTEVWKDQVTAYNAMILSNGMKAERKIADKLDDDDESEEMSIRELVAIARDSADRVGLSKRSVQTNVNLDFAAMLDKAIARSSPKSADLTLAEPTIVATVKKFVRRI